MEFQPEFVETMTGHARLVLDLAIDWLTSPAAWSQFALLVLAWLLARLITGRMRPHLVRLLTPAPGAAHLLAPSMRVLCSLLPLLMPLLAFLFTAVGEELTRSVFGSGTVIAFGKRIFLFLAARILVNEVLTDSFLRLMGRYVLLPIMAIHAVGLLDPVSARLHEVRVELGDIRFTLMGLIRGVIAGALLFWAGAWSNRHSETYIKRQDDLRPATRELASKAAQIAIFGTAFLILMQIMGIDLTAIAVLGGALGVGIGLGLQQIAANFVSGVILLLEGQTTVGDYVELDDGQAGTIIKMTARACILQTVDGRWIVVPNENFITSRIVNYSDAGSAHRYEVGFSVAYETDIHRVPPLIEAAVSALPFVLDKPEPVECELKGFGDSAVNFSVEFWVNGIEDLTDRFQSRVLFAVWDALKAEGIQMPFPQRVIHMAKA
ncbi:MAG: mechanosensitive ion channel [Rhodobacterales bacterium]|nr:mechanosensitive ion channel [Rhodobacterales bacterium]MDX5500871.1 mechanosensitive ion channel [Rhodobacterales bacterium]